MKIIRSLPKPFVLLIEDKKLVRCDGVSSGYIKTSHLRELLTAINNSIDFNTKNKLTDDIIDALDDEARKNDYVEHFGKKYK